MNENDAIAFVDLKAQYTANKSAIDAALGAVLEHGKFIMGPEVSAFEKQLAEFTGASEVVACSSGTDALLMIMMAEGIEPGDAVFVPAFTFTATAEVLLLLGATPVFVDVDADDFNMDPADLQKKIDAVKQEGSLRPKGILAVDLFGLPADYPTLSGIADANGLLLWDDAAQSLGGSIGDAKVGTLTRATAVSFFPAKPLGCYGDGGAVLCNDKAMADTMRSIRAHGKGGEKYDIIRVGLNARLDTMQAAILMAKLPVFADELVRREEVACAYDKRLSNAVKTPTRREGHQSAWAQYTIQVPAVNRDTLAASLKEKGVPTAVYYPKPMHLQTAYAGFGDGEGSLPVSEMLPGVVLSLPMHPYLTEPQIDRITDSIMASVTF